MSNILVSSPVFCDSNDTISSMILSEEDKHIIGNENIIFLEDALLGEELKIILDYLKHVPQQGNKMIQLVYAIGGNNTVKLIKGINHWLMVTLIINSDINMFSEIFIKYNVDEIIESINRFNFNNINSEQRDHVLIKSINKGKLPGNIEIIINIFRITKRSFNSIMTN